MAQGFNIKWAGDKALIKKLSAAQKLGDNPTRIGMLTVGAEVIRDKARQNVRKKLNRNATGNLEQAIVVKVINQYAVSVGPFGVVYAAIHEFGGIITPKRAKFLRFVIGNKVIYTKYVKMPARPYMRPASQYGKRAATKAMVQYLENAIKKVAQG